MLNYKYLISVYTALFAILLGTSIYADTLHDAAEEGDIESVITLHGQGVDLNAKDDFNMTALHFASYSGYIKVVDYLLKNNV